MAEQGDPVQPRQMQAEGCLAGSRRADDANAFSRLDSQGYVFQQRGLGAGRLKAQLFGADQASTLIMRVICRLRMRAHTSNAKAAAAAFRIMEVAACTPNRVCVTLVQGRCRT